ncbi:MAG: hypothetical protein LQ341_004786, partial [Variospora aurantia]
MTSKPPAGYVSVGSLSSHVNHEVSIMGIVTDFQPPTKSKGKDWTCSLRLADSSTYDDGIKVRLFRPMEVELPVIERNGDVVILERVKITSYSGMTTGLSTYTTTWTLLPAPSIPETAPVGTLSIKHSRVSVKGSSPTQEQIRYAIALCNSRPREAYDSSLATNPTSSAPKELSSSGTHSIPRTSSALITSTSSIGRRDKFALIKDVCVDAFYDLVGQVVKVYPGNGVTELYLTDYTSNPSLYNYEWGREDHDGGVGDDDLLYGTASDTRRKWPGPFGKYTLAVSLFPPHSYYAQRNVKENDFVFLRNTRIKYDRDRNGKIEGSLHTDKLYADRIDVTIVNDHDDERVKDVLRRKLEYGKKFQRQQEDFNKLNKLSSKGPPDQALALEELTRGQKRKQAEVQKLSKTQLRKRKKQEREEARLKRLEEMKSDDEEEDKDSTDPFQVHIKPANRTGNDEKSPSIPPTITLNKNIRSSNPNVLPRSLSSILSLDTHAFTTPSGTPLTLPFQNIKSRALVRVVDFFPDQLIDFAVPKHKKSEYDVLSDYSQESSDDHQSLPSDTNSENDDTISNWEWRFALVLEDASPGRTERLSVYVSTTDAVFLTKLDPCNLRHRPQALAALRERLFLLWGDLEERKSGGLQGSGTAKGLPFECCIKEYGIRSKRAAPGAN